MEQRQCVDCSVLSQDCLACGVLPHLEEHHDDDDESHQEVHPRCFGCAGNKIVNSDGHCE